MNKMGITDDIIDNSTLKEIDIMVKEKMDLLGVPYTSLNDPSNIFQYTSFMFQQISELNRINNILKSINKIIQSGELDNVSDDELQTYLEYRGWFITSRLDMTILRRSISLLNGNMNIENFDKRILYCFNENSKTIEEVIISWDNSLFEKRMKLFKDCIFAIDNERYSLALPVLYSQLEGILREHKPSCKSKKTGYWSIWVAAKEVFKEKNISVYNLLTKDIFHDFSKTNLEEYWEDEDYEFTGNRNRIFHGMDLNYGTEANCLKAVLLLDLLHKYL